MRILPFFIAAVIVGCSSSKPTTATGEKKLYEVLTQQEFGGGNIRFFEIVSDEKEINMLLNDEYLAGKISRADIKTSNFVILNMGEKRSGGYAIGVDRVEETPENIIVYVKETGPGPEEMVTTVISYPYAVVKINSKKPIIIE